jgi:glucose-1-phosphate thymidylyltransferase
MVLGGADRLCFVIGPSKHDIVQYYGGGFGTTPIAFTVQPHPDGLCDAIFRALPFTDPHESVLIGLPDTIWFPADGLAQLPDDRLGFLTFPVAEPHLFDAVVSDESGAVREIQVKSRDATSHWVWGAFKLPVAILCELHALWRARERSDVYIGSLVNAWLAQGGRAQAVPAGQSYVDVGTLDGYRQAIRLLSNDAMQSQERNDG